MRERPALSLFLVSWLVLFLELACIRWFPSHVLFLTFFVNLVLLACFVGMSVGCLVARRQTDLIRHTPYWLLAGVVGGLLIDGYSETLLAVFQVGNQARPDVVYYGAEAQVVGANPLPFAVPIELVGAAFFVLIAGVMVGPGQEMGRAFTRVSDRSTAYSANLLGSLAGIATFAASSFLRLPPVVWFALCGSAIAYLILARRPNPPSPFPGKEGGGTPRDDASRSPGAPAVDKHSPQVASSLDAPPPSFPGKGDGGVGSARPLAALAAAVALTAVTSGLFPVYGRQIAWSQYYRVDHRPPTPDRPYHLINTNLISHQQIDPLADMPSAPVPYALPYLFRRELKHPDGAPAWPEFKRVLVIGAGNGNDVARALMLLSNSPDVRVDAVEIDPVIQELGARHHPDKPFADPRVTVTIGDGRNFLRQAPDATYDLVVFALIDSLVLQSGYSNLRLESYLYTLESFQDVKRVLKPTGLFAAYNFFRLGWVASRIQGQLRTAFGVEPLAMVTPPDALVELNDFGPAYCTGFFAGGYDVVEPLRRKFAETGLNAKGEPAPMRFWYPWSTHVTADTRARFGFDPPPGLPPPARDQARFKRLVFTYRPGPDGLIAEPVIDADGNHKTIPLEPEWLGLHMTQIRDHEGKLRPATDDWPFVYVYEPTVPGLTWRSVALTLLLSVGLWAFFGGRKALAAEAGVKPDYGAMLRAFFLGAGFMLVETKAVTQMALLFGGTWLVNTAVFAAILVMSLLGNLYAAAVSPKRLEPYYAGLFVTLAVGLGVSPAAFLGMGPTAQIAGACLLVFAPVAFAGVIFATSFRRTAQPDRVFGANVAGALVGGLAENASVVLGFQLLLCVAVAFYVLSAAFGNRHLAGELPAGQAETGV